jgi:hypothetical protein
MGITINNNGGRIQNHTLNSASKAEPFAFAPPNKSEGIEDIKDKKYPPRFQPINFATKYACATQNVDAMPQAFQLLTSLFTNTIINTIHHTGKNRSLMRNIVLIIVALQAQLYDLLDASVV